MKNFIHDYYEVSLPGDWADTLDQLASHAIDEARERTRIYATPATWRAFHVRGEIGDSEVVFKVCRIRRRKPTFTSIPGSTIGVTYFPATE